MRVVVRAAAALDVFASEPLPAGNEPAVAGFIENVHLCLTGPRAARRPEPDQLERRVMMILCRMASS